MTPEELCTKLLGKKHIPIMHDEIRQIMLDSIRAAYAVAYTDAATICDVQGQDIIGEWYGNEDYRRGANTCAKLIRKRI